MPQSLQPSAVAVQRVVLQREWLTASEAAQHLKVKPRTLLQWVREGKVPAHALSGTKRRVWRFLKPELDAMLWPSSAVPA
jgi:excisionase family DNA binding protein